MMPPHGGGNGFHPPPPPGLSMPSQPPPGMNAQQAPPHHHHHQNQHPHHGGRGSGPMMMMMMMPPPPPPPPPRVPVPPLEPQPLPDAQQSFKENYNHGSNNDYNNNNNNRSSSPTITCTLCYESCLTAPHRCPNTACVARFCGQCAERIMYATPPEVPTVCPACRTETNTAFMLDAALQEEWATKPGGSCKFAACHQSFDSFAELQEHQANCPAEEVTCRYRVVGCRWQGTRHECTQQHDTTECHFRHFGVLVQRQLQTQATLEAHVAHLHLQLGAAHRDVMALQAAVQELQATVHGRTDTSSSNATATSTDPLSSSAALN